MLVNQIELVGLNLKRLVGVKLTNEQFRELCSKTFLAGIGSDIGIEEHCSMLNLRCLQRIASDKTQIEIIGEFLV